MSALALDAAGTLIEVRGTVGDVYAAAARAAGSGLDPERIDAGFRRAHAAAPPLAFGDRPVPERRAAELAWWRAVARAAVDAADPPPDFDFAGFFDRAWDWFGRPEAWTVFPDVRPALRELRRSGRALVVFSNWDSRLPGLLDALGLGGFFAGIHVSAGLPAPKPRPEAFAAVGAAMARLPGGAAPTLVGDRLDHDVRPARDAGWRAIWIDRVGTGGELPAGAERIGDLRELAELP